MPTLVPSLEGVKISLEFVNTTCSGTDPKARKCVGFNWTTRVGSYGEDPTKSVVVEFDADADAVLSVQMKTPLQQQSIVVRGRSAGQSWQREIKLPAASGNSHRGVASLWARQKIAALLDQKILGVEETVVRSQVLPVALAHQLVSPYTSFVAVEAVASRPAEETLLSRAVLTARPQGQAPQPYAYPQTAAGWMAQLLLGLMMLIPWFARLRWR